MIAATPEIETYLAQFEQLAERREGAEPVWLASLRKNALARFVDLGVPTTRHEEWKYTSVRPIVETAFRLGRPDSSLTTSDVERRIGPTRVRLVFVNGHYAPQLSSVDALPKGVTVDSLANALR